MELLAVLLVGKPLTSLAVAAIFLTGYLAPRVPARGGRHGSRWALAAAVAWALSAAWEWLILARTPEANIRVDLLVIWQALGMLSAWAVYRSLRRSNKDRHGH